MEENNDLHSNIKAKLALNPVALGTTGGNAGLVIDRQGYGGVEFIVTYGSITTTGTVVTAVVKEGDATGAMTSVADGDLIGTELLASLTATTPRTAGSTKETCKRVGYKGIKRYVSIDLNGTGATSVGYVGAVAVLHSPNIAPVANP